MRLRVLNIVLALAVAGAFGCSRKSEPPADPAAQAYQELRQSMEDLQTPEAKADAAEAYLSTYPDSEGAEGALEIAVYYRSDMLGDHAAARKIVEQQVGHIKDPKGRFDAQLMLYDLSMAAGAQDVPGPRVDLRKVEAELAAHQELGFGARINLMDSACKGAEWDLALEQADLALEQATPEAYRAEREGEELEDAAVERRVSRRQAEALAGRGRALTGLDRLDEAMEVLAAAREVTATNYIGLPETELNVYQAKAEIKAGRLEEAQQLLEPDAVMGGDAEAMAQLRKVYATINGSEQGFDEYLDAARQRLAVPVDSFSLPTYEGETIDFGSFTSGKATLLAFWFPT